MKKLYFLLFTILISAVSFGQDMLITGAFDGPLSGGTPKLVEIYVINDIPDLSLYGFGSATNGGGTDGQEFTFPANAATAGDFIYIASEGSNPGSTNAYFGITPDFLDSSANINGDDALELFFNGAVIDTFGDINTDGTGQPWEYLDGGAYRISGTGPDGTTFNINNWLFTGINAVDGCTTNVTCSEEFPIGTFSTTATAFISISSPSDMEELPPGTTSVDIVFTAANLQSGDQVDISVSTNGGMAMTFTNQTSPFTISPTSDGDTFEVTAEIVNGGSQIDFETIDFSIGTLINVADINALRADVNTNGTGRFYEITGSVLVTHTDGFRNRRWIQDSNISGILIYDEAGVITTSYSAGDMVSGLRGTTTLSNGVLRFIPTSDSGTIDSSGNTVTPQIVTILDFNSNPDNYESELIEIENVTFVDGDGVNTFNTGTNYDVTDGVNTVVKRTDFFSADYIGELIPSTQLASIVGIAGEFNGTAQIFVRDLNDFTLSSNDLEATNFSLYPNPTSTGEVTISTINSNAVSIEVYDILGKRVKNETLGSNNRLNVSSLKAGVYIMRISQENATVTKKLVIR